MKFKVGDHVTALWNNKKYTGIIYYVWHCCEHDRAYIDIDQPSDLRMIDTNQAFLTLVSEAQNV